MRFAGFLWGCVLTAGAVDQERKTLEPPIVPAQNRQLEDGTFLLAAGTRIPLQVMNSINARNAAAGDQVYLQTIVPVAVNGQIVIPVGTFVTGRVTESQRPGRVKGRGQLAVRFESMLFPDGAQLDLLGRMGAVDGDNPGTLNREEGAVTGAGSKGRDAMTVGAGALGGALMGRWIGRSGRNAGIGAGAGGAAGLATVLLSRGPDPGLRRGSTVEMMLNQDLRVPPGHSTSGPGTAARPRWRRP
jgi:type IV secretion system protein VirB10